MKKSFPRALAAIAVVLALYCLTAFMLPFERNEIFYIAFGATMLSFVICGVTISAMFSRKSSPVSKFYGFPVIKICGVYFFVQLFAGYLFMALANVTNLTVIILVEAFILGFALLGLIAIDTVIAEIKEQDTVLKKNTSNMRGLYSKVYNIAAESENEAKKEILSLAEELKYSDPMTSPATAELEKELEDLVENLAASYADPGACLAICKKAKSVLSERNRVCKLNK